MADVLQFIRRKSTEIVVGTAAIVAILLTPWPYMWEGDVLYKWAAAATILSIIGSPALYFMKMNEKGRELKDISKDENRRASHNLYLELGDTLDTLNGKESVWESADGSYRFVNKFLNDGIYDGLVYSAKLGFLRADLQQQAQGVFRQIKLHNQYLRDILKLQNTGNADLSRHYEILETYETLLKEDIPKLRIELKKAGWD